MKGPVSKTGVRFAPYRGFESLLLRFVPQCYASTGQADMINASILPLLTAAIAAGLCCLFSFGNQPVFLNILSSLALLTIIASPLIRLKRQSAKLPDHDSSSTDIAAYQGLSSISSVILSTLTVALLGLLLITPVRWPASVAFGLAMINLSLKNPSTSPLKDLLTAIVAMFCVWPVAPELTQRIETRSQLYVTRLVSDRLDNREILNYPSGSTIEMEKGNVSLPGTAGHLSGLRTGVLVSCATAMLMHRGPVHTILLSMAGFVWALFSNALWLFGRCIAVSGVAGLADGLWASVAGVTIAALILILSSDQLLLVLGLLNPLMWIKRDRKILENETRLTDDPQLVENPINKADQPLPVLVFGALAILSVAIVAFDWYKLRSASSARSTITANWQNYVIPEKSPVWPLRIGRWTQLKQPVLGDSAPLVFSSGTKAFSDTYAFNNKIVRASLIGPVWSWQDRFQDYMHQGWKVGNARIIGETQNTKPYIVVDLSQPTGERAKLVYMIQTTDGKTALEPTIRSIPRTAWFHFLQSLFLRDNQTRPDYITELFLQSYATLRDEDLQSLDELATGVFTRTLPDELK